MATRSSRNWRARIALASAASFFGLVSCSLFVDTDGLNAGDASTMTADASSDVTFDAGNTDVALIDSGSDATIPLVFSCDGGHVICDDFEGPAFIPPWTTENLVGGGVVERATDASVSPSHSMHATAPTIASGAAANLYKSLSQSMTSIHCELDALTVSGTSQAMALAFNSSDPNISYYYVALNIGTTDTYVTTADVYFDGGGNYQGGPSPNSLAPQTWTHLVIDFGPNGSGGTQITAVVGDGGPNVRQSNAPVGSVLNYITLSDDYVLAGFEKYFDNVVCDVTP